MKQLIMLLALLFPVVSIAAPFWYGPCPTGTPKPTDCKPTVNGVTVSKPPHVDSTGKVYCYADLVGVSSTQVTVSVLPTNAFGPAATPTAATLNASDFSPPSVIPLTNFVVSPTLPQ